MPITSSCSSVAENAMAKSCARVQAGLEVERSVWQYFAVLPDVRSSRRYG